MKCPRCNIDLDISYLDELQKGSGEFTKVEVDLCSKCGGIWFDKAELESVDNKIEPKIIEIKKVPRKSDQYKELCCPKCNERTAMDKVVNDYDKDVVMDVCPSCKGIWLDKGEFKAIKERSIFNLTLSVLKWALT